MIKYYILICSFFLMSIGVKAQSYCYHCYQFIVHNNSGYKYYNEDYYTVFTFKEDFIYTKDPRVPTTSSRGDIAWKYYYMVNGGGTVYAEFEKNIFGKWKRVKYDDPSFHENYEVSGDRSSIQYSKTFKGSTVIRFYEICPERNCYNQW